MEFAVEQPNLPIRFASIPFADLRLPPRNL